MSNFSADSSRVRPQDAVAAHGRPGGLMCAGLHNGSIRVWSRSRRSAERSLTGHTAPVWALLSAGERLISGASDSDFRAWAPGRGVRAARVRGGAAGPR